jgi:hypothetical protein
MKAILTYVVGYLVVSAPMNYWMHQCDCPLTALWLPYTLFAFLKVVWTLRLFYTSGIPSSSGLLLLAFSLVLRLLFKAPWMMVIVGGMLFLQQKRKKIP